MAGAWNLDHHGRNPVAYPERRKFRRLARNIIFRNGREKGEVLTQSSTSHSRRRARKQSGRKWQNREGRDFSRAGTRNRMTWASAPGGASSMTSTKCVERKIVEGRASLKATRVFLILIVLFASATLSAQTPNFD